PSMHLSEILTQLGEDRKAYYGSVAPPVIQTSNFAFEDIASFRRAFSDEMASHLYTRGNNPTVEMLCRKVAALEGAESALAFSSGAAAISMAILSQLRAGDHLICVNNPYSWTKILIEQLLSRFDITHTFVDGRDADNIERAIQNNTRLLILESPNSLTYEIQDLEACARLAKANGIVSCIDNSHAGPLYQNPHQYGIDLVMHTGTKYLNGHSDVVMGAICGSKDKLQEIFANEYMTLGAVISPHDAALVLRGLRTLEIRLQRHSESALQVARFMESHPKVEKVLHPLLPSFPQYELARKQMKGAGGLFTAYLKASDKKSMEDFVHELDHFLLAVSWGGYESLVLPAVAFYDIPGKKDTHLPWNMVRFFIGLEDPQMLIGDLNKALKEL
ncbi:MAG: aminotransferase class I/II-fold pyridoxal phosphate-dependent enzyme, partial [Saprospiraceae bacterium]|nr:aminotransferase class I/II-fold pyridoxal phosphate-dependent enzyme [Saprospiraceae bacterium]